jgi:hypothetical protein
MALRMRPLEHVSQLAFCMLGEPSVEKSDDTR